MRKMFDRYFIYDYTDDEIMAELCRKTKAIRLSCCCSQQEFAERSGVSVITIKRIESGKIHDINLRTLLKIMRYSGTLEGMAELLPDLPESPYLFNEKTGKNVKRVSRKRMRK